MLVYVIVIGTMTLKDLLNNNPFAAEYPLYIETENAYVKLDDCYEAQIVDEPNSPVLIFHPARDLDTTD